MSAKRKPQVIEIEDLCSSESSDSGSDFVDTDHNGQKKGKRVKTRSMKGTIVEAKGEPG